MAKSPQQALNEKFDLNLSTIEVITILDNLTYMGKSLLETLEEIDKGEIEVSKENLVNIKKSESNCRVLMKKIISQIPDDIALSLNIDKNKE